MKKITNFKIPDNGIDKNKDGHCDLCGKFVDNNGHHNTSYLYSKDKYNERIIFDKITSDEGILSVDDFVKEYYEWNVYLEWNSYIQGDSTKNYFYNYTLNDESAGSSRIINSFLRNGKCSININPFDLIHISSMMNNRINDFKVSRTFVTYRGMVFKEYNNEFVQMLEKANCSLNHNRQNSYVFEDKGFVSTSRLKAHALKFARMKQNDVVSVFFKMIIPSGSKAIPLSEEYKTTSNGFEKEVLLKSDQKYRIVDITKEVNNGKTTFKAIVILEGDK